MYIIEKFFKLFTKHKLDRQNMEQQEEGCEHLFVPIDSSREILACTKCGMIIKAENLKNKK